MWWPCIYSETCDEKPLQWETKLWWGTTLGGNVALYSYILVPLMKYHMEYKVTICILEGGGGVLHHRLNRFLVWNILKYSLKINSSIYLEYFQTHWQYNHKGPCIHIESGNTQQLAVMFMIGHRLLQNTWFWMDFNFADLPYHWYWKFHWSDSISYFLLYN